MSDQIKYDYAAMDDAYEDMLQQSKEIKAQLEKLMDDAHTLLAQSDGAFAAGYQTQADKVNLQFDELNTKMTLRAGQLQDMFSDMGVTDQKLGDGF